MTLAPILLASLSAASPIPQDSGFTTKGIQNSYNAQIDARKTNSSWSLLGCTIEEYQIWGQDPITHRARSIQVSLYRARGLAKNNAAIIILPPTGGVNIIDRGYANELCSAGMTVALVSGWEHQGDTSVDFSMHNQGALRALTATRHVVEFLSAQHHQSLGILGTSIGAIAGALAFGAEPRLAAATLIVGSARLADVIADSDETGAMQLRKKRMDQFGFRNVDEYRNALRKGVFIEPSQFLIAPMNRKALVVSANADTTVRSEYQLELAHMLKAEHIQITGNHLQGIKNAFCDHRRDIIAFFAKALRQEPANQK